MNLSVSCQQVNQVIANLNFLFYSTLYRELLADCYDKRGMFDKDKFMSSYVKVGVIEQATEKIFFKSGPWCSKGGQDN